MFLKVTSGSAKIAIYHAEDEDVSVLLLLCLQDPEELIEQHQVEHVKELLRRTAAPRHCCFYFHIIPH